MALVENNRNKTFGINSPNSKTTKVEMSVMLSKIPNSPLSQVEENFNNSGVNADSIKLPKITNAILLPTSIVPRKVDESLKKRSIQIALREPCSLRKAMRNLSADTKAISVPEKNADTINTPTIVSKIIISY